MVERSKAKELSTYHSEPPPKASGMGFSATSPAKRKSLIGLPLKLKKNSVMVESEGATDPKSTNHRRSRMRWQNKRVLQATPRVEMS